MVFDAAEPPQLLPHADKLLPQPFHTNLVACCPTMDLVAVVTKDERLDVYRFNGQRAFGLQRRTGSNVVVRSLAWKFDGQYLALGWSDGALEVVSAETGNSVQHFKQVINSENRSSKSKAGEHHPVCCVGWGMNLVNVPTAPQTSKGTSSAPPSQADVQTTDDWDMENDVLNFDPQMDHEPGIERPKMPVHLPEQLSRIDILALFPKLPPLPLLPSHVYKAGEHPAAELFASQVSLDAAVHASHERHHEQFESLILSYQGGDVQVVLYDSLSLGTVGPPDDWKSWRVNHLKHAYHPYTRNHQFLSEISHASGQKRLAVIPLSLRFLESAGTHLQIIESRSAQLQTLVQYVGVCLLALNYHWQHAKELPTKFMGIANEDLREKDDATLMQSFFHLACTGHCPSVLKEWLVDSLAERGHKRWDHAISHGYTKVLELTHENLIPALDRCDMILATLKGLFEYHSNNPVFDIPSKLFILISDIIKTIRLLANHVILHGARELRQFAHFSKWLRLQIDIQAADPLSSTADEAQDRDIGVDINSILGYISGPLEESRLDAFICDPDTSPAIVINESQYDDTKKALNAWVTGASTEANADLLVICSHFDEWQRHNRALLARITNWQKTSCTMEGGVVLELGIPTAYDIRLVHGGSEIVTYVALSPHQDAQRLHVYRLVNKTVSGRLPELIEHVETCGIVFKDGCIQDFKFADDQQLILLLKIRNASHILRLSYNPLQAYTSNPPSALRGLQYSLCKPLTELERAPNGRPVPHSNVNDIVFDHTKITPFIAHTFAPNDRLRPARIEVNGRKGRRCIVVLGEDERQIRVYDMDFKADEAERTSDDQQ